MLQLIRSGSGSLKWGLCWALSALLAGLISRHGESWPYRLGLLLGKRGAAWALGISLSRGRWAAVISSAHPEPLERGTRRPGWNRSCLLSELPSASKSTRELYPTSILSQRLFVQFPNSCFLKHRAHTDLDSLGITPSSAQGRKLSWPMRNFTGNYFTVRISDWKPTWLWNELVRCSPDLFANVIIDCFYL